MILCCDLSSKCTGWSKFSKDGKLIEKGRIVPAEDIDNYFKIHYVVEKLKELYKTVDEIVIEDLYVGINPKSVIYLARLSGAVAYSWLEYKYKPPIFYTASHARKLAGINGRCQKAEVQVFVLEKYKFCSKGEIKKYKEEIINCYGMLKDKTITKGSFKYKMNKLSKLIDTETGMGEDCADSIIIGLAYGKNNKTEV